MPHLAPSPLALPQAHINAIEANDELTLADLKKELALHTRDRENIQANVLPCIVVGGFQVDCSKVLGLLLAKKDLVLDQLKGVLARKPSSICEKVATRFKEMDRAIQAKSSDPETLKAQRDLIQGVPKFCAEMLAALAEATPFFESMEDMRLVMSETAVEAKAAAQFWPNRIRSTVFNVEESHAADEGRYKAELKESQQAFERTLLDLAGSVTNLQNSTDLSAVAATHAQVQNLEMLLKRADGETLTFNSREMLFGLPQTDYGRVKKLMEQFDPFMQFWSAAASWAKGHTTWLTSPLAALDAEQARALSASTNATNAHAADALLQRGRKLAHMRLPACPFHLSATSLPFPDCYAPPPHPLPTVPLAHRRWTRT